MDKVNKNQSDCTKCTQELPTELTLTYNVQKTEQQWTTEKKKLFIEEMDKSLGIVTTACQAAGIARRTYYNWIEDDPEFRREINRVQKEQLGHVEDRLLKAIAREEPWAVNLYLSRVHPRYRPKQENYLIPTEKTLEDLLDNYQEKNEAITGQQNPDTSALENPRQEGNDSAIQAEHSAGVLLLPENTQELDIES